MDSHDERRAQDDSAGEAGHTVRRLRLSAILSQLGADAGGDPPAGATASVEATAPDASSGGQSRARQRSSLSLGEIVDRSAHAGFGFIAALLALVAIPFVGLGTPFGLAIGLIGAQMIAGRNRPWLPARLRRHLVTIQTLDWLSQRVARWTRGLERWIRPRWTILARGPFWSIVGAGIVIDGSGLALPLPLPLSNLLFIIPIVIYSIGLLEDDGLLIVIGHVWTAVYAVLGVMFWHVIWASILAGYYWVLRWAG